MHIKNIPLFNLDTNSKNFSDKYIFLQTNKDVFDIENNLNNILDKFTEKIKYYIDCNESLYDISFNVGIQQYQAMVDTSFTINIYKNTNNKIILIISKNIDSHPEWNELKKNLFKF
jgi:hypothetical protein